MMDDLQNRVEQLEFMFNKNNFSSMRVFDQAVLFNSGFTIKDTKITLNGKDYSRQTLNYKDHTGANQTMYVLGSLT